MLQTINNKIQQGFSRSAQTYDLFSGLHRQVADKLYIQLIEEARPSALLDVGCGTGYLTGLLQKHFPGCAVIGLDFAPGMIKAARQKHKDIEWVLADGHYLPFSNAAFDIVVSNLVYQWSGDLPRAFTEAQRVLAFNGILSCTFFGYNTCRELFQCLKEATGGVFQASRLSDEPQVRQALAAVGFENIKVESQQIKMTFKDMYALMFWIKSIGANHLSREGYIGKQAMLRAAAIYRRQFPSADGVEATFEVIRVHAKK